MLQTGTPPLAQPVTSLDEERGFPLGTELRGFLERDGYHVNLVHQAAIALSKRMEKPQQVFMPVLPSALEHAESLLAELPTLRIPLSIECALGNQQ